MRHNKRCLVRDLEIPAQRDHALALDLIANIEMAVK
jgi:hypothetical protein